MEVSTFSDFSQIFFSTQGVAENEISVPSLDINTTYFWRVESINSCGTSGFTSALSFTTGDITCSSVTSSDGPFSIATSPNVVRSTIVVAEDFEIVDLNVLDIVGIHTFISDLEFRLIGPNGTSVDLLIQACGDENDFNISFDDESDNVNVSCPFIDGTVYRPDSPCLLYTSPSPRDQRGSRMPSSA